MKKIAIVDVTCCSCWHTWRQIVDATYGVQEAEVSCPNDKGCPDGKLKNYQYEEVLQVGIDELLTLQAREALIAI